MQIASDLDHLVQNAGVDIGRNGAAGRACHDPALRI